jgi:hypothetical protein
MIKFRDDTSFPFLKVATEAGVPYAKVMRMVEAIDSHRTYLLAEQDAVLFRLVAGAHKAEQERRRQAYKDREMEKINIHEGPVWNAS